MTTELIKPRPNRRWFQFSLRALLILTTICAVLLGLLARVTYKGQQQLAAIEMLEAAGAEMYFGQFSVRETKQHPNPDLSIRFIWFWYGPAEVMLRNAAGDKELAALKSLGKLEIIYVSRKLPGEKDRLRKEFPGLRVEDWPDNY
ncbi:MAG: hypothetical protein K8T91_06200 [Planctomycetes bacterium]|nr:hypothetical protein [Planctomycetota bacterium]